MTPTPRRAATAAALAALLALTLAGCGGGADSADNESAASGSDAMKVTDGAGAADGPAEEAAEGQGTTEGRTSARVLPVGRDIVYRGQITVRVRDVSRAAARAEDLAVGVDGVVFSSQTSRGSRWSGPAEADLTLRVPPTQFGPTLDALGALGTELRRSRSAQDVTAEMTDTDSRVRTQERSVARVRALLAEADTIGEVVQVEAELSRREADLESLQAQLARLQDVTDLATIEVTLLARTTPVPVAPEDDDLGFVSGVRGGWDALAEVVLVGLTVLGALLPFAVVAGLLGAPAYALLRSRRRRPAGLPAAPPAGT